MTPRTLAPTSLVLGLFVALPPLGCGDDDGGGGDTEETTVGENASSGSAEEASTTLDAIDCQPQDEVTQTLFEGESGSVVLVDVPMGWAPEPFGNVVGFISVAPSEFATDRPDVGVANQARFDRSLGEAITQDLTAVGSVMFMGEDVQIYLQGNQPTFGVNLEGYFPTSPGSDEVIQVTVLTRYVGGRDGQEACQDSLLDLASLVSESLRENPAWVE